MASAKQIAANRANAQRSTGPKTAAGQLKSSRNSYRHGLSLPLSVDLQTRANIETLAQAIAGEHATEDQLQVAELIAEAQLDLKRIRATRARVTPSSLDETLDLRVLTRLRVLDRYERLALSRRKFAARQLEELKIAG
jgi:hypothetical protein